MEGANEEKPQLLAATTCGVPMDWHFLYMQGDTNWLKRYVLTFPHERLGDTLAMRARSTLPDTCYETYGTVSRDGRRLFATDNKKWKIRKSWSKELKKLAHRHGVALDAADQFFQSMLWKRAKGTIAVGSEAAPRHIFMMYAHDTRKGHFLDVSYSFDSPQKHMMMGPAPAPAPVEGFNAASNRRNRRKKKRREPTYSPPKPTSSTSVAVCPVVMVNTA